MNHDDDRLDRLFAAERKAAFTPPPRYEGFETRVLARITELREGAIPWYAWAWRITPVFGLIIIALMLGNSMMRHDDDLDVSSALNSSYENATLVSYLAGE